MTNCLKALEKRRADAPDAAQPGDASLSAAVEKADTAFHAAMDDDLNTPGAIAALFDLVREINQLLAGDAALSGPPLDEAITLFESCAEGVLGLLPATVDEGAADAGPFIDLLVETRNAAKAEKAWPLADLIRDRLGGLGIALKDGKDGTSWERKL